MRKYIWLAFLLTIGVLIMLKPVSAIIKDSVGNTIYRGNVVTGVVAADNGNKSYDVYISESDEAYPSIYTLAREPNLVVGDKVRILYEDGIKEKPIILPPTIEVPAAVSGLYVSYSKGFLSDGYISMLDPSNGSIIETWSVPYAPEGEYNSLAVDNNNNVYWINSSKDKIIKMDNNGNILVTKDESAQEAVYSIAYHNGYIYTLDFAGYDIDWHISRRNTSDLETIATTKIDDASVTHGYTDIFHGFAIDSAGYMYWVRDEVPEVTPPGRFYEKWAWGASSYTAHVETSYFIYARLAVFNNNLFNRGGNTQQNEIKYLPTGLIPFSETLAEIDDIGHPQNLGTDGTYLYVTGFKGTWSDKQALMVGKYQFAPPNLKKVWTMEFPDSSNWFNGSINAKQ